jgi:hypothetical protein
MATSASRRVYLHIGSPKTGTTFIQHTLHSYRDELEPMGVYYPPSRLAAHHDEARDLRDIRIQGGGYHHPDVPGSWDRLVAGIHAWDGPGVVVVSSEILAFADGRDARRAIRSLAPAEVHVVITMRDLARQIPAAWQEMVKNRSTITYGEFLRQLQDPADEHGPRRVWDGQDPASMIRRWAPDLPPAHVHLVTVPPRGQDTGLLWDRFASVLGVGELPLPPLPRPLNVSLGLAEAEVVRHLNAVTANDPWPFYSRHIKHGVAQGVFAGTPKEDRLAVPEDMLDWVRTRTVAVEEFIASGGYDVVGDLADLHVPDHEAGDTRTTAPEPDRLAEAYRRATEYLARQLAAAPRKGRRGAERRGGTSGAWSAPDLPQARRFARRVGQGLGRRGRRAARRISQRSL